MVSEARRCPYPEAPGLDSTGLTADNPGRIEVGQNFATGVEGVYAIGWGVDQNEIAPETVIASQIVDQARMIGLACEQAINDEFEGGTLVVGLAMNDGHVDPPSKPKNGRASSFFVLPSAAPNTIGISAGFASF